MERKCSPLFALASSNQIAVHANKGSTASKKLNGPAVEVGKATVKTNQEDWPFMTTDFWNVTSANVVTTNPLLSAAIGSSRAPLYFGDGALGAPPIVSPSYKGAFQGKPFLSGSPLATSTKNEVNPEGFQPDKYDVQLSEACQRRFVMFDSSGSKRRMIFHPAMVKEFPILMTPSLHGHESYLKPIPNGTLSLPPSNTVFPLGASLPCYYHAPLTVNPCLDLQSSASNHGLGRLSVERNGTEDKMEENLTSYSHENTEDMEALLSFDDGNEDDDDDEVTSTGHSPSDLTRNNVTTGSDKSSKSQGLCPSKKRMRGMEILAEDDYDDTASTAISENLTCKETADKDLGYGKMELSSNEAIHCKGLGMKAWGYGKGSLGDFNLVLPDEVSSNSSGNNQRCSNGKHQEKLHEEVFELSKQSRKEKIKSILRLLRGVIPGGESMDAAFVLDETIDYVRALQFEVQKLQAR